MPTSQYRTLYNSKEQEHTTQQKYFIRLQNYCTILYHIRIEQNHHQLSALKNQGCRVSRVSRVGGVRVGVGRGVCGPVVSGGGVGGRVSHRGRCGGGDDGGGRQKPRLGLGFRGGAAQGQNGKEDELKVK